MAVLFKIEGKIVYPHAETLLITPFKELWARDETEDKNNALEEYAYIEFMSSVRTTNPFRQYGEERKELEIIKNSITQEDWKPDALVKAGIAKIVEMQKAGSSTYNYYMAAKKVVENLQLFFMTVDITETNVKTGALLYKPRDITSAINDVEKNVANLKALEVKVEQELYETTKKKADKEVSFFATRESITD
jgi:hypothetical protein